MTLQECSPKWGRPCSWLRAVTGQGSALSTEAALQKDRSRPSLPSKPAASASTSRASCRERPFVRTGWVVSLPTPPASTHLAPRLGQAELGVLTGVGLAPAQRGQDPTAHREAGVVVREGRGALASIGWYPHWVWLSLPGHSHLRMSKEEVTLRKQGWQPQSLASPGWSCRALGHTGRPGAKAMMPTERADNGSSGQRG